MSAQLASAPSNSFSAHLALAAGVTVSIHAPSMGELANVVSKLQPTEPANDAKVTAVATAPAPTSAPKAQPEGNVSASTGAQASAQPATSGSVPAGDAPAVDYKQVQQKVLALSKVSVVLAKATLAKFTGVNGQPVDHGTKLQLPDYAAFIAAADAELKGAGK